ncbi:MAG: mechanosensitive ion channel family protein [Methanobrevibacter sp.]|uniref:mechanosensitive ion channel family protein n=1 Tax=Methanobrevibacter sp. TaxID=66852 RepID=UPI003F03092D
MDIPTFIDSPTKTLIYILIVIIATSIITRAIAYLMNRMHRFNENKAAIYLTRDIINYVIYFIALMTILQFFGVNLAGTLLSLGIAGIAVSFAAKDLISNLFSGILLIIGRSIQVGDTIEINNKKGIVERITLRSTIISDDSGVKDIIPNSTLTNSPYLHFKTPEKYRVDILVGLALNLDIKEFKEYILEKISEYDEISQYPKPNVYSKGITHEESQLKVSFWVKEFNNKDKYKLIITNEIRKFTTMGEKNE